MLSGFHDAVIIEIEIGRLSVSDIDHLLSGLHFSKVIERISLSVDGKQLISLYRGKIRLS